MKMDLASFLETRDIAHPTCIDRAEYRSGKPTLHISGCEWWKPIIDYKIRGNLVFEFSEIHESNISLVDLGGDPFEEDLDAFDIKRAGELDWARGAHETIWCSAPIPDPGEIIFALDAYLIASNLPMPPERFLNTGFHGYRDFYAIAASSSFLLCSGPHGPCSAVRSTLDTQNVAYTTTKDETNWDHLNWVTLGSSWMLCGVAEVRDPE